MSYQRLNQRVLVCDNAIEIREALDESLLTYSGWIQKPIVADSAQRLVAAAVSAAAQTP